MPQGDKLLGWFHIGAGDASKYRVKREPMSASLSCVRITLGRGGSEGGGTGGDAEDAPTCTLDGLSLRVLVPAEATPGVAFAPSACEAEWAESLRRLAPPPRQTGVAA